MPLREFVDLCEESGARLSPAEVKKLKLMFEDHTTGTVNYKEALRAVEFCPEKEHWVVRSNVGDQTRQSADKGFYRSTNQFNQSMQISGAMRKMSETQHSPMIEGRNSTMIKKVRNDMQKYADLRGKDDQHH